MQNYLKSREATIIREHYEPDGLDKYLSNRSATVIKKPLQIPPSDIRFPLETRAHSYR